MLQIAVVTLVIALVLAGIFYFVVTRRFIARVYELFPNTAKFISSMNAFNVVPKYSTKPSKSKPTRISFPRLSFLGLGMLTPFHF